MPAAPTTLQACVHALGDDSVDGEHGLRFLYAREKPDHAGVFLPWPQVAARVRGVARRLVAEGVGAGDVVVVHGHDQQTALLAILACLHLGVVPAAVAPVGAGTAPRLIDQFHAIVRVAAARLIVTDRAIPADLASRDGLPSILLLEDLPEADDAPVLHRAGPDDVGFLQFTSGSTSTPKGVVVSHGMILANLAAITAATAWGGHGRVCGWLPIYHDMSLVGLYLMAVRHRAHGTFFPTARFGRSPDLWMRVMSEQRCDFSAGPNFAFAMVNRHAERRPPADLDLTCVRGLFCGSEPISAEVLRRFAAIHAPFGLRNAVMPAFGMAECTLMATVCAAGQPVDSAVVSRQALEQERRVRLAPPATLGSGPGSGIELVACGTPAAGLQVAIGASGALVGKDRIGEVLLAGDSVLTSYFRDPVATAAAFIDLAGTRWFRTGDHGFLRPGADGTLQLHICGRAKEMIIHNGVNYFPVDIEQAVERALHDHVRLIAVVDLRANVTDDFAGLGVLYEGRAEAEGTVADFIRDYAGVPVAQCVALPGGEHLPRTTSGKLVRPEIRRLLLVAQRERAPGGHAG